MLDDETSGIADLREKWPICHVEVLLSCKIVSRLTDGQNTIKYFTSNHLLHFMNIKIWKISKAGEIWWQGWPSGESTCLPPMWHGFDFRIRRQMWTEFVGSLLCYERFFPGYSGFPLSPKTNIWFVEIIVNSDLSYVDLISPRIVNCHWKTPCGKLSIYIMSTSM